MNNNNFNDNNWPPPVCFRHRHDVNQQDTLLDLDTLLASIPDQTSKSAIKQVWSVYSSASATVRDVILLGLVQASCMRQLTTLNQAVVPRLRMDLIQMLPVELSLRILGYLDAQSICRASQVNHNWYQLACTNSVWFRLCQQHINNKCLKCGWGLLPLLPKKRKRMLLHNAASSSSHTPPRLSLKQLLPKSIINKQSSRTCHGQMPIPATSVSYSAALTRPCFDSDDDTDHSGYRGKFLKRPRHSLVLNEPALELTTDGPPDSSSSMVSESNPPPAAIEVSWKSIYAERQIIGRNWRLNLFHSYALVSPTASLQPRITSISLDQPYLMTSAMDGIVRVWNIESKQCLSSLTGHRGAVTTVHFDEQYCLAASGGMDGNVKLWNWTKQQCVRTLSGGHAVPVTALHFEGGILVSADAASLIRVWDFHAKLCFTLCHGNLCPVTEVKLCCGSLFSAGQDGLVRMWDLKTRTCIKTFAPYGTDVVPGVAPAVTCMHVSVAHQVDDSVVVYVLCGMVNGNTYLYQAECIPTSTTPTPAAKSISTQPRTVVAPVQTFSHTHPVTSVYMDALRVMTCHTSGRISVWDLDSGVSGHVYELGGSVGLICASDTMLVAAREDGVIRVWDFSSSSSSSLLRGGSDMTESFSISTK